MKHPIIPLHVNSIGRKYFLLVCLFIAGAWLQQLTAQTQNYFTANGKKIATSHFDEEIVKMIDETGIPALSLAIIDNNKIVYSNAYGYKQSGKKDPVNSKTVFEACSLSKIFLVLAVHEMVDKGLIDLDKPMYQYMEYEPLQHDARYKLITPRMLLSHCSGIENWRWDNNKDTLEIVSNPGERFVYSGEGFQYLALVIEKILGEPYETYMNKMVIAPLKLQNTYLKYTDQAPSDYAIGYTEFNDSVIKWKNGIPIPASGIHTVAEDFAKLTIALFNGKYLSSERTKDLLKPVIRMRPDNAMFNMGPGFFMIHTAADTIIAFSGSNAGFKAEVFYSVVNKKGFVYLTNSDRGNMIIAKLSEMSVNLDISSIFGQTFYTQYPSTAISLLKVYREKNADAMFEEIEVLKKKGPVDVNALNELGKMFMSRDKDLSAKLLQLNINMHPASPVSYGLLGGLYFEKKEYDLAYKNLLKAKELNFNLWNLDGTIKECEQKIKK